MTASEKKAEAAFESPSLRGSGLKYPLPQAVL